MFHLRNDRSVRSALFFHFSLPIFPHLYRKFLRNVIRKKRSNFHSNELSRPNLVSEKNTFLSTLSFTQSQFSFLGFSVFRKFLNLQFSSKNVILFCCSISITSCSVTMTHPMIFKSSRISRVKRYHANQKTIARLTRPRLKSWG